MELTETACWDMANIWLEYRRKISHILNDDICYYCFYDINTLQGKTNIHLLKLVLFFCLGVSLPDPSNSLVNLASGRNVCPFSSSSYQIVFVNCNIQEENNRGGGKIVHIVFKYLSKSLMIQRGGAGGVTLTPPPPTHTHRHPISQLNSYL